MSDKEPVPGEVPMSENRARNSLKRLLRRPDAPDAAPGLAEARLVVKSCEVVQLGDDHLLRVSGEWHPAAPEAVQLFVAVGDPGELREPLAPGPSSSQAGLWTVAFPVNRAWHGAPCALVASGGCAVTPLPIFDWPAGSPEPTPDDDPPADLLEDLADARALADQF